MDYFVLSIEKSLGMGTFSLSPYDEMELNISVDEKSNLEEVLKNKKQFTKEKKESIFFIEEIALFSEEEIKKWNFFEDNFDVLFEKADHIHLRFNGDEIEYIEKNPILLSKKIVVETKLNITDFEEIEKLLKKFEKYDNIYVDLQDNIGIVKLKECKKIMDVIKSNVTLIKQYNLSPLEELMFAYDLTRDRVYKFEESNNYEESRDLKDALFGEAIVCRGYARIFEAITTSLGINNNEVILCDRKDDSYHARNAVYVNDDKYNVHGYFYLDATWDSKTEDTNDYLYSYKCFMKNEQEMKKIQGPDYMELYRPLSFDVLYSEIKRVYFEGSKVKQSDLKEIAQIINKYYMKINSEKKRLFEITEITAPHFDFRNNYTEEELSEIVLDIEEEFNQKIKTETLIEVLNNVRRIEHSIDPEKYPYSLNTLMKTYLNSGWEFEKTKQYTMLELAALVFGVPLDEIFNPAIDFERYLKENPDKLVEAGRVELTETIGKILKKKIEK